MSAEPSRPAQADDTERERVFFALWPDADTVRSLHELAGQTQAACGGRRLRPDTLHLTLAFIGDVALPRLPELVAVGDRIGAATFTLVLDRMGSWRHNRIVWAGAREVPEPLAGLAAGLGGALEAAGFAIERRRFAPHVTLLRNARQSIVEQSVPAIEWRVERFVLVKSERSAEGSRYRAIRTWAAGERGPEPEPTR